MMPAGLGGLVDHARARACRHRAASQAQLPGDARRCAAETSPPSSAHADACACRRYRGSRRSRCADARGADGGARRPPKRRSPRRSRHVAWADRWLARFAGASPRSLETLSVAARRFAACAQALAAAARPVPCSCRRRSSMSRAMPRRSVRRAGRTIVTPSTSRTRRTPALAIRRRRIDRRHRADADRSAVRRRRRPLRRQRRDARRRVRRDLAPLHRARACSTWRRRGRAEQRPQRRRGADRETLDRRSRSRTRHRRHRVRASSAQLASSPFAPALRHVLPLPAAPSFDVRSLFGGGLGASVPRRPASRHVAPTSIALPSLRPRGRRWAQAPTDAGVMRRRSSDAGEPTYVGAAGRRRRAAPSTTSRAAHCERARSPRCAARCCRGDVESTRAGPDASSEAAASRARRRADARSRRMLAVDGAHDARGDEPADARRRGASTDDRVARRRTRRPA